MNAELKTLHQAAEQLEITLTDEQAQRLLGYRDLIAKWNQVYNLTALRDPAQMLSHHIIDSLAAAPALLRHLSSQGLQRAHVLDVGSGGGLPGAVLACVLPQITVCCVDTVGKKAAFVQQVANELKLSNLRGVHSRVEQMPAQLGQGQRFDVITSRAFASLSDFVNLTQMHLDPQGVWMALKGKEPHDEIAGLPSFVSVQSLQTLHVPGLEAQRCIVWIKPSP